MWNRAALVRAFALGVCISSTACVDAGDPGTLIATYRHENDGGDRDAGAPSPIVLENRLQGTEEWQITRPALNHEIEGYASATSAGPGESVKIFISASTPSLARVDVFRMGWYAGQGGRLVQRGVPLLVESQTPCPADPTTGMVECPWDPTTTVDIPEDWVTGQYLLKLVRGDGFASYVPLVVREQTPRAPLVVQANVLTYQAYNSWGGSSLYRNDLPKSAGFDGPRAFRVSFDRPYMYPPPVNEATPEVQYGAGQFFLAERWMNAWLERRGYDVAYVTNVDVDTDGSILEGRKLFLDAGHDEYWTTAERQAVTAARDAGVSLAFFSANDAYWHVRLEPSSRGVPRRVVTCYKNSPGDPSGDTPERTGRFRDSPVNAPEDALIGQMYDYYTNMDGFPFVVGDASHWLYRGTGVKAGDTLPHIVGYEWDHTHADSTAPAGLEVVAASPVFDHNGVTDVANATVYYPSETSLVFSAGTISWAFGLGRPGYSDLRVERMTENVLDNAGVFSEARTIVPAVPRPSDHGDSAAVTLLAGSGTAGYADGIGAGASFDTPLGVAVASNGTVYVAEARNHRIRAIAPDGEVTTVAGCGPNGVTRGSFKGGRGTAACFDMPSGIAIGPDGRLYVSDTMNHRIRVVNAAGDVATYAGTGNPDSGDATELKQAGISYPRGLAFGPDGALYVVSNGTQVRKITPAGVTTIATGTDEVAGIVVTDAGTVYVTSPMGAGVFVVKEGVLEPVVNQSGVLGDRVGEAALARMRPGEGIAWGHGALFVADAANEKIRRVMLGELPVVNTVIGDGIAGNTLGSGADTRLVLPRGVAVTPDGLVVADSGNHRILKVRLRRAVVAP